MSPGQAAVGAAGEARQAFEGAALHETPGGEIGIEPGGVSTAVAAFK